jgi:hypothetical protein
VKALLFASILLFQAQAPVPSDTGVVSGRLRLGNGQPAIGVRVAATPVDSTTVSVMVAISKTDETGAYRLLDIPPGRYYVVAGMLDSPVYYPAARAMTNATVITVTAGATVGGIDFTPSGLTPVTISGRTSEPALGVVTLVPRSFRGSRVEANTDDKGAFAFSQVRPGVYDLISSLSTSGLSSITVEDDIEGLVLPVVICRDGVEVRGRFLGVQLAPGTRVNLRGRKAVCIPQTVVEPDGSFIFRGIPPDSFDVSLSPYVRGFAGMRVTVDTRNVNLAIPFATVELPGQVSFENGVRPPAPADAAMRVYASREDSPEVLGQAIGPDGQFVFKVFEGTYDFSASTPLHYVVKSMTYGGVDLLKDTLKFNGAVTSEVRIVLGFDDAFEPGFRVGGNLVSPANGDQSKLSRVELRSVSSELNGVSVQASVAADRSFEFRGIEPGRYELRTVPDSSTVLPNIVVERTDVSGLEFALPVLSKIDGVIDWRGERGTIASPSTIVIQFARRAEAGGQTTPTLSTVARGGAFQAYLPEGDYRVTLDSLPARSELVSVVSGAEDLQERDLRVRPGPTPTNVHVVLRDK